MKITIIFFVAVLILSLLLLIVNMRIIYNFENKVISINIALWKIKIVKITINLNLLIYKINNKNWKLINLNFDKKKTYILYQMQKIILKKLSYIKIKLYVNLSDLSPNVIANLYGGLYIVLDILNDAVVSKKFNAKFDYYIDYSFDNLSAGHIDFSTKIYMFLIGLIIAYITSNIKGKYRFKDERKRKSTR